MQKKGLGSAGRTALDFLDFTGGTVFSIIASLVGGLFRFTYKKLSALFGFIGRWLVKKLKQPLYDLWCFILTPIAHAIGTVAHASIQIKKVGERGELHIGEKLIHILKVITAAVLRLLAGLVRFLRTAFNYAAPVLSIAFLIAVVRYAGTLEYTISVEYNGNDLGVINKEGDYTEAQAIVQDIITYTDEDQSLIETPKFSVKMMRQDDSPVDSSALSQLILDSSEVNIVFAYGFYINDSLYGVYSEEEMERIRTALESRLASAFSSRSASIDFRDNVELIEGQFIETNLQPADSALEYINGTRTVEAFYITQSGDSLSSISSDLGISEEALKAENPFLGMSVPPGELVTYHYEESNLPVVTTRYEQHDSPVEYTVQYIYDSSEERYTELLVQHGSDGLEKQTIMITETDGRETSRQVVSRYTLQEMVPMIIRTGTRQNTTLEGDTHVIDTLGTFIWPVGWDGGYSYVSSLFGYRDWDHSNHRAIDIAAKRGTDIYAAASGTVVFAGTYSSYGKMTIIDHGYGYQTVYAHQSAIDVSEGDYVSKGDVIGHVGMTGSASGNHLHFELRYGDERLDPMLCLGGVGDHEVRDW